MVLRSLFITVSVDEFSRRVFIYTSQTGYPVSRGQSTTQSRRVTSSVERRSRSSVLQAPSARRAPAGRATAAEDVVRRVLPLVRGGRSGSRSSSSGGGGSGGVASGSSR